MNKKGSFVVAIDGPAGAGKSTVAKKLAARLGYALLDTGAIYRTLALLAKQQGISWNNAGALGDMAANLDISFAALGNTNRVLLGADDVSVAIRTPEISDGASQVSAVPQVRAALLGMQRRLAAHGPIVAEGRDMGTVVFPSAAAKFFLTASPDERARRRGAELQAAGRPADTATVLADMQARDARDSTRAVAPLTKATDALEIDSGGMTPEAVVDQMFKVVRERGG